MNDPTPYQLQSLREILDRKELEKRYPQSIDIGPHVKGYIKRDPSEAFEEFRKMQHEARMKEERETALMWEQKKLAYEELSKQREAIREAMKRNMEDHETCAIKLQEEIKDDIVPIVYGGTKLCPHEYVNVSFHHVKMVCKLCDHEQTL